MEILSLPHISSASSQRRKINIKEKEHEKEKKGRTVSDRVDIKYAKNNKQAKLNDPNSTETREKLRKILSMGTFKFSDKEKSALSEILNKD